jgi:hypothetical protein
MLMSVGNLLSGRAKALPRSSSTLVDPHPPRGRLASASPCQGEAISGHIMLPA